MEKMTNNENQAQSVKDIFLNVLQVNYTSSEDTDLTYAHGYMEDAGSDIRSAEDTVIEPGERKLVSTGIKVDLPTTLVEGFEIQVRSRSGLALKHGVAVLNSPGTIDPSYKGEIKVILINHGKEPFVIKKGDRIAQLVCAKYVRVGWNKITEISTESSRNENGFGSTGK